MFGTLLLGVGITTGLYQSEVFGPRLSGITMTDVTKAVPVGRRINLLIAYSKVRDCPGFNQRRFLIKPVTYEGRAMLIYVPLDAASMPVGDPTGGKVTELILSFDRPRDIAPGNWQIGTRTESRCSWLSAFGFSSPSPIVLGPWVDLPALPNGQELSDGAGRTQLSGVDQ